MRSAKPRRHGGGAAGRRAARKTCPRRRREGNGREREGGRRCYHACMHACRAEIFMSHCAHSQISARSVTEQTSLSAICISHPPSAPAAAHTVLYSHHHTTRE